MKGLKIHYCEMSLLKLAISIAETAESYPLLPAFVPARSIACSIVSVVKTPKIIGMSVCSD